MRRLTVPMPFPVPAQERYVPYDMMLNDVGFWYPVLKRANVHTPKTIIVGDWGNIRTTANKINEAMYQVGFPCFFRGGNIAASLKHRWKETCFVYNRLSISEITSRMGAIVAHCISGNEGAEPLLTENWVVREYIECDTVHSYREMPLKMEIRAFIKDNHVVCMHHYWDKQIPEGVVAFSGDQLSKVHNEAKKVAQYFHGYWSCDFLLGKNGNWYAIDMALGEDSYHPEGDCQKLTKGDFVCQ